MRSRQVCCGLLVAAIFFGACDSGAEEPDVAASPTTEATPPPAEPQCPLTGLPPARGVDLERPAVAVKVENSPEARPQHGLEKADLVFEEIVEGGITRFMAIYHCGSSRDVGPVRSARYDDAKLARPFTRILAYSGSNGIVDEELNKRKMVTLNELNQSSAFFRVPPGTILVHNLFARTEPLRKDRRARRVEPPDPDTFEFGDLPGRPKKARRVRINFNASITIEYRYKRGEWRRFEDGPFMTNSGHQIAVPNVVVQQVTVNNSKRITDSAGNPSPKLDLVGRGPALLFRDGRVVRGEWRMKNDRLRYRARRGGPMVFARGPIWIELVPSKKGSIKGAVAYK